MQIFQSTLPREERLRISDLWRCSVNISIHAPTRGATIDFLSYLLKKYDFNPRSHERSDQGDTSKTFGVYISIHAPTRGATHFGKTACRLFRFQSTLPREERRLPSTYPPALCHFNPRSHERSDNVTLDTVLKFCISIHAPTRGATTSSPSTVYLRKFQSTLPREERLSYALSRLLS